MRGSGTALARPIAPARAATAVDILEDAEAAAAVSVDFARDATAEEARAPVAHVPDAVPIDVGVVPARLAGADIADVTDAVVITVDLGGVARGMSRIRSHRRRAWNGSLSRVRRCEKAAALS
jgi:hypothetical protein